MTRARGNQGVGDRDVQNEDFDTDKSSIETPTNNFALVDVKGNLATRAPNNAVLIHSCNCVGQWGNGVASALADQFPVLVEVYQAYCNDHTIDELLGTCLIIWAEENSPNPRTQWIACLFTSTGYGRKTPLHPAKSRPAAITKHTQSALQDLRQQLEY